MTDQAARSRRGVVDPRVVHYWDDRDVVGRWFVTDLPTFAGRDWDAFLLFGPGGSWSALPVPPLAFGSTVIGKKDDLARAIGPWLAASRPAIVPATAAIATW